MSDVQPAIWKTLDELTAAPPIANAALHAAELGLDALGRRELLRVMGASLALAGAGACTRQPDERIYPYAASPEAIVPGVPLYFATAMPWSRGALGLLVENHMGRPTKVEGNPDHAASRGSTDVFAQAAVLGLYDPDRSQVVRYRGAVSTWSAFLDELTPALEKQKAKDGAGLRLLQPPITSPTLAAQVRELAKALPNMRVAQWEPLHRDHARAGALLAFGHDVVAQYRLEQAQVVLAFDADFLAGPTGVRNAREFAAARRARKASAAINRLYAVESSVSITGAMADHRLAVEPALVATVASRVAAAFGIATQGRELDSKLEAWVETLVTDLREHRGKCLVIAGDEQPPQVHALAHALNRALDNVGATVHYTEAPERDAVDCQDSLRQLVAEMRTGKVELLVIAGGNPVYDAPADADFRGALEQVALRVHLALHEDETSQHCHWHLPEAHFLESWSDTLARDGAVSIVQPLIAPLYDGKTTHELVAALAGKPGVKPYDLVRAHWQEQHEDDDFEGYWRRALHDGVLRGRTFATRSVTHSNAPIDTTKVTARASGLIALFRPDPSAWDGRFANNAWLQECPRPLTKLTWDNAVLISPRDALELGLASGDEVVVKLGDASVVAPMLVTPGHAEHCVTLPLGYGRTHAGKVGSNVGFDAYRLRRADTPWTAAGVELAKTGGTRELATTQKHHDMEKRDLVRVRELGKLEGEPAPHAIGIEGKHSVYPEHAHAGNAWGMVIDLNGCIGCNACVVACQSENNIPVVGKTEVARGREMHWIRIDRYYEGEGDDPRVLWQPIPCMHCENAPCEVVCPVGATTHSPEGLNEMTYNRCVGTKYCSNNCPYKVRRFNFFLYTDWETESLKLQRNPDVTVRSRGVMEKCTYCVQRINEKRIAASKAGRAIREGEIVTACQQVCPAQAITFGDINDAASEVSKLRAEPHHYGLLTELNTRPRTTYLAKVTNERRAT